MSRNPTDKPPSSRRPLQFSLAALLLFVGLSSVLMSALAGMLRRSEGNSKMPPGFFILMAVIAPLALLILVSLIRSAVRRFRAGGRR